MAEVLCPDGLRMLAVGLIPPSVTSLTEKDAFVSAEDVIKELQWKGRFSFDNKEKPVFLVDNSTNNAPSVSSNPQKSPSERDRGSAKLAWPALDTKKRNGGLTRHCLIVTSTNIRKFEGWRVTSCISLSDVKYAEYAGSSNFLGLEKLYVGLYDGRQERLHLRSAPAARFLAELLGRVGHFNIRRESKYEDVVVSPEGLEDQGCQHEISTLKRRSFRVMVERSARWEHANVRLEAHEIYIVKLLPKKGRGLKEGRTGRTAGHERMASAPAAHWKELPMKIRRYDEVAWVRLPNLKSLVFGFFSGERFAIHTRQASIIKQALERRRANARHRRRCLIFSRVFPKTPNPDANATTAGISLDTPCTGTGAGIEVPSPSRRSAPSSHTTSPPTTSRTDPWTSTRRSGPITVPTPPAPGEAPPAPPLAVAAAAFAGTPGMVPSPEDDKRKGERTVEEYVRRPSRSVMGESSEKLVELFVEQMVLDIRTNPGRVRTAFLNRAVGRASAGTMSAAHLAENTRQAVLRISTLVHESLEGLERRRSLLERDSEEGNSDGESKAKAGTARFMRLLPKLLNDATGHNDEWEALCQVVQRSVSATVVPPLSAEILKGFQQSKDIAAKDRAFATRAAQLRCKPQSFFGVDHESPGQWSLAVHELSALDRTAVTCPWEKFEVLLEMAHAIQLEHQANERLCASAERHSEGARAPSAASPASPRSPGDTKVLTRSPSPGPSLPQRTARGGVLEMARVEGGESKVKQRRSRVKKKGSSLSADAFFPVFLYVLVHTPIKRPYAWLAYLRALSGSENGEGGGAGVTGEAMYYLTMFEAGLEYISSFDDEEERLRAKEQRRRAGSYTEEEKNAGDDY